MQQKSFTVDFPGKSNIPTGKRCWSLHITRGHVPKSPLKYFSFYKKTKHLPFYSGQVQ